MKNVNKKIAMALLSATVGLNTFASEYQIKPVHNIDEAVKLIQNLKPKINNISELKGKSKKNQDISTYGYTPKPISDFNYDATRDTITTIRDNNDNPILYIVHNKKQNDPTLTLKELSQINTTEINKLNGYTCNNIGSKPYLCSAYHFYTGVVFSSNSVGAKVNLDQAKLTQHGTDIVLLNREAKNSGRTFMKVFIDQNGYLNSKFTLVTGGTTTAQTPEPIPFNEDVYIQANEFGQGYEVGWKSLRSGQSSTSRAGHQIKPEFTPKPGKPGGEADENNVVITLDKIFWRNQLPNIIEKFGITDYFWSANIPMFANIDKEDLSDMVVYQQSPILKMDLTFVGKVIGDLEGTSNYFPADKLRAYVDANGNLAAADVREVY